MILFNIPLFAFGYKRQGAEFTIYAIFTACVYSFGSRLITDVLPIDASIASPLAGTDLLLCAIFGGILSGIGSGIAIRFGGAMDGIEVLAVIFQERIGITVGTFVMVYNILLYVLCGFIMESWILPLYSIVTYRAALKTVDFIVGGIDRSKAAMIVADKQDKICGALSKAFERGMTIIDVKGYYFAADKTMIYIIVNRFQISKMRRIVHEEDKYAFVSITEAADVFHA